MRPFSTTSILRKVQRYGENILGATVAVALLQGVVVLYRYRNNPRGGLMIPPGLTWGVEIPESEENDEESIEQRRRTMFLDPSKHVELLQRNQKANLKERITMPGKEFMKRMQEVVQESMDEQQIHQNNDGEYEDYFHHRESGDLHKDQREEEKANHTALDKVKNAPDTLKKSWQRINQYVVILLPWLAQQMSYVLARYGHLMHLGLIYGVGTILELRNSKIPSLLGGKDDEKLLSTEEGDEAAGANNQLLVFRADASDLHIPCKVVVIGDSLACGIGTIEHFDMEKGKKDPPALIENISLPGSTDESKVGHLMKRMSKSSSLALSASTIGEPSFPREIAKNPKRAAASPYGDTSLLLDHTTIADCWGPAFPRILAATLAQRMGRPVQWRSAGVDGGDVQQIHQYCLDVIEEEVASGHAPDLVVVLCGSNDLKTIVGDPLKALTAEGGPAGSFRRNLVRLLQDILRLSPKTKIVLPALPTHRLDEGSMLNVFPLTIFLDGLLGFWDAQKKKVADSSPSNVIYCGLTPDNVSAWYQMPPNAFRDDNDPDDKKNESGNEESISLISADGVHPNKRCYSLWANLVGNAVADKLISRLSVDIPTSSCDDTNMNEVEKGASQSSSRASSDTFRKESQIVDSEGATSSR